MTRPRRPPRCIVRSPKTTRELHLEHVAQWINHCGGYDDYGPTQPPGPGLKPTVSYDRTGIEPAVYPAVDDTSPQTGNQPHPNPNPNPDPDDDVTDREWGWVHWWGGPIP